VPRDQRQAGFCAARVIDRHRVGTIEEDAAIVVTPSKSRPGLASTSRASASIAARSLAGSPQRLKTRVDLDLDPEHDSGGGRRRAESEHCLVAVDVDGDPRGASELRQPLPLLAPVHGIGDDDVVEAVGREHLRLCNLRHRDARRSGSSLQCAISATWALDVRGSASLLLDGVLPSVDVASSVGRSTTRHGVGSVSTRCPTARGPGPLALSLDDGSGLVAGRSRHSLLLGHAVDITRSEPQLSTVCLDRVLLDRAGDDPATVVEHACEHRSIRGSSRD